MTLKNIFALVFLLGYFSAGHCNEKLVLDPRTKDIINQALMAEDRGDRVLAIKLHKDVVKIQPENFVSTNAIAGLYGELGEFNEEIKWANKAIQINPSYDVAHVNLGNALAYTGKIDQAKREFKKATEVDKKSAIGFYSLGLMAEWEGNLQAALSFYKKSVAVDPGFENGWFNLGATYANLKQYSDARDALQRVLLLNPSFSEAKSMLNDIREVSKAATRVDAQK